MAQSPLQQGAQLRITRRYPASCEKVWRAWTEPQALIKWFGPEGATDVRADLDVRVSGQYSIAFRTPDGVDNRVGGVYQEVQAPHRLVFTWAWQSTPERVSRVSLEFVPEGTGCELRFVHDRFFDQQARDNHARGWGGTFAKLDALFS